MAYNCALFDQSVVRIISLIYSFWFFIMASQVDTTYPHVKDYIFECTQYAGDIIFGEWVGLIYDGHSWLQLCNFHWMFVRLVELCSSRDLAAWYFKYPRLNWYRQSGWHSLSNTYNISCECVWKNNVWIGTKNLWTLYISRLNMRQDWRICNFIRGYCSNNDGQFPRGTLKETEVHLHQMWWYFRCLFAIKICCRCLFAFLRLFSGQNVFEALDFDGNGMVSADEFYWYVDTNPELVCGVRGPYAMLYAYVVVKDGRRCEQTECDSISQRGQKQGRNYHF